MKSLFHTKYIDLNLPLLSKVETIEYLAHLMEDRLSDVNQYIDAVKVREAMTTTGIGDGVSIPHGQSSAVKEATVVVGRSVKGIEWESLDDQLVHFVFLIAVPENGGNEHLKILQKLAIHLMDEEFKIQLEKITNPEQLEILLNGW